MKQTTFQHPELRDANDNIIQQGAFGKNTALANSTNDGWIDYVANDLEALYNNTMGGTGGEINTETITGKTGTITNLTATTVKAGTLTADALNGPLTGNVTGDLNGNVTGDVTGNLTGNVTGTADKAVADGSGNNIVNTYVTKSGLSTSVSTTSLTVSGTTSVPTANAGNSSKAIANTEFVQGELTNYLPLSGGTLTGVVDGVTPPNGDNSKKLATTAFVNAKAGNYLPLRGGTMTGSIRYVDNGKVFAIGNAGHGNVDLGWHWTNREGAVLALRNADHLNNPGGFTLFARDSANSCSLDGKPDGSLTWGNKEVERVNSSGSNYIRYENGLQICWGGGTATSSGAQQTFDKPFSGSPWIVVSARGYSVGSGHQNESSTGFEVTTNISGAWVTWIAIGKWK